MLANTVVRRPHSFCAAHPKPNVVTDTGEQELISLSSSLSESPKLFTRETLVLDLHTPADGQGLVF